MKKALRALLHRVIPIRALPSWILFWRGRRSELLTRYGWARSLRTRAPLDEAGRPLPWMPYAVVELLADRLRSEMSVLEIGAGYSTLFFMRRVARVTSIEHDPEWVEWVRSRVDPNVSVIAASGDSPDRYLAPLRGLDAPFDLILVDGLHRNEAVTAALDKLTTAGVILLDDSRRPAYAPAFDAAAKAGFRKLHFEGHKAASVNLYRTTVFYRDGNCLGI